MYFVGILYSCLAVVVIGSVDTYPSWFHSVGRKTLHIFPCMQQELSVPKERLLISPRLLNAGASYGRPISYTGYADARGLKMRTRLKLYP